MTADQYEQESIALSKLLDDVASRIWRLVQSKCSGFSERDKSLLLSANERLQVASGNLHSHTCGLRHQLEWPQFTNPYSEGTKVPTARDELWDATGTNSTKVNRPSTRQPNATSKPGIVHSKMSLQELALALHKSGLKADDIAKIKGED